MPYEPSCGVSSVSNPKPPTTHLTKATHFDATFVAQVGRVAVLPFGTSVHHLDAVSPSYGSDPALLAVTGTGGATL